MDPDLRHRFRSELSAASRAFKNAGVDQMRALGVHVGQNFLLAELRAREPQTAGELAQRLHVEVPTIVRMSQRMEASGLLDRRIDPRDRRRVLISMTGAGRLASEAIPGLLDSVSEKALDGLTEAECETLTALLHRVAANLGWSYLPWPDQAETGETGA